MKKKWLKKGLALLLALCMTFALAACGGDGKDGNGGGSDGGSGKGSGGKGENSSASNEPLSDAQHFFRADYMDDLPESFKKNAGSSRIVGDCLIFSSYNDDYTENMINGYNMLTGEEVLYFTCSSSPTGIFDESSYINQFAVDGDGNMYVLLSSSQLDENSVDKSKYENATREDVINYIYTNWGFASYEEADDYFTSNEESFMQEGMTYGELLLRYEATQYIRRNYVVKVDSSGTEIYRQELAVDDGNGTAGGDFYCNAVGVDADGNLYLGVETWTDVSGESYVLVANPQGETLGKIDIETYVSNMMTTTDGKCGYTTWSSTGEGYCIVTLDAATLSHGEEINVGTNYFNSCQVLDDHTYLYNSDRGLFAYDISTNESEKYLNWMDCNISGNSVYAFGKLSDGRIAVYTRTWNASGEKSEIALLTEISAEEASKINKIKVACFYTDYRMENAALEFNRKHTDYHITIDQYYDYSSGVEWQDALDAFMASIVSDTSIDIVCFYDYGQMLNFAQKGLLVDLNPILADDPDLGVGKILPNIINACTYDDMLVALPNYFSVSTLVGKKSEVGATPGWTVADMKALYATKEPGTQLLPGYMTKDIIFNTCISLGYNQFLNLEEKTCNFNCDEFIDVLEFVGMFPDEYQYNDDMDETELMHQGKIMLYQTSLPDFSQMQMLATIFGDELTYIGYPTSSGNGTLMNLSGLTGITKYCDEPQMIWEFLRNNFLQDEDYDYGNYFSGTILKKDFDKFFENATNPDYYRGSWGWGNYQTELHVPSQEEIDAVKDIILQSTAVSGSVPTGVMNIITEEAAAYFSGQRTAREVAANIQSRMEIYLSETM